MDSGHTGGSIIHVEEQDDLVIAAATITLAVPRGERDLPDCTRQTEVETCAIGAVA